MKAITGKYNLSKDDPHYQMRETNIISPNDWITKTYIEDKQTRYIINFRCADRTMKIVQLAFQKGISVHKRRIFVVALGNKDYEKYYGYYKIARRIKEDEMIHNVR